MTIPPYKWVIDSQSAGRRLDHFLHDQFPSLTRSHLQNLIVKGLVRANSQPVKTGYKLKKNDDIIAEFPEPEPMHILPENIPIDIVYQDDSVVVINKPAGLVVHPGAGNRNGTLVNALLYHCQNLSGINGVLRPGIVHRLDKNTSGLLVVAKDDHSHLHLSRQFETRDIERTYRAIVWGLLSQETGQIDSMIGRSLKDRKKMSISHRKGKPAVTNYSVVEEIGFFTLLMLALGTGRTHQIRVHLNSINHPVFGDPDYNGRQSQLHRIPANRRKYVQNILKKLPRQALHAFKLSFNHPNSNQRMTFTSPLPVDFASALAALRTV